MLSVETKLKRLQANGGNGGGPHAEDRKLVWERKNWPDKTDMTPALTFSEHPLENTHETMRFVHL